MDTATFWFQGGTADGPNPNLIGNSLRFRGAQWLSRVPASNGNRQTYTHSFWLKKIGVVGAITSSGSGSIFSTQQQSTQERFRTNNSEDTGFGMIWNAGGRYQGIQGRYTDPGGWYHVVAAFDSTQAAAADRLKIYINGELKTRTSNADITQNANWTWNSTLRHNIGKLNTNDGTPAWDADFLQGYLAEYHMVDGTAHDPLTFGEYDANGVWVPRIVDGVTYGTNGFYLDFSDPDDIGADRSGNGNNFTPTGFELTDTSSVLYDWMVDCPTNNFATYNPLIRTPSDATRIIKYANLTLQNTSDDYFRSAATTIALTSGRYYAEINGGSIYKQLGICAFDVVTGIPTNSGIGGLGLGWSYQTSGNITNGGSSVENGLATVPNTPDILGMDVDFDAMSIQFYVNGVPQGSPVDFSSAGVGTEFVIAATTDYSGISNTADLNVGQRPFIYPPGTSTETTAFNTVLYTGDGSKTRDIDLGADWDLIWVKNRSGAWIHNLVDTVRGTLSLYSNENSPEGANGQNRGYVDAYINNGIRVSCSEAAGGSYFNNAGDDYVAWCWNAGDGAPVTNTDGTIESTIKASPENGFSVVTYTGDGNLGSSVGHGLGNTPTYIIIKSRTAYGDWQVGSPELGSGWTARLLLNDSAHSITDLGSWNNTPPTDSVFTIGNTDRANTDGTDYVAYCFTDVENRVETGSYAGNSAGDATTNVPLGFKPGMVLIKNIDTGSQWIMVDTARGNNRVLNPNRPIDELESASINVRLTNNGFTLSGGGTDTNTSGNNYLYIAFAEGFTPDDSVKELSTANLENVAIKNPSEHFQTILSGSDPRPNPPQIGDERAGGYFAGYKLSDDGTQVNELIVAPVSEGSLNGRRQGNFSNKATNTNIPNADNLNTGSSATFAYGSDPGWFAWNWCVADATGPNAGVVDQSNTTGTGIGGFNDWYIPAINEMQMIYRAFKPTTANNNTSWGAVGVAVPPTNNYTSTDPGQTSVALFQEGAAQALPTDAVFGTSSRYTDGSFTPGTWAIRWNNMADGNVFWNGGYTVTGGYQLAVRLGDGYPAEILEAAQLTFPNGLWWIKDRANSNQHQLVDSVRGVNNALLTPSANTAEGAYTAPSGNSVAWCWAVPGAAEGNSAGTIPTNVAANVPAGFSIATWAGTGVNGTIGHALSEAPDFAIVKARTNNSGSQKDWSVFHSSMPGSTSPANTKMWLNKSDAEASSPTYWNNTMPTDTVFSLGTNGRVNTTNENYVGYFWHSVPGYSAFGSYVGNGNADGPFCFTGHRPAFLLIKWTGGGGSTAEDWMLYDVERDTYNPANQVLQPSATVDEEAPADRMIDILSNGFKLRAGGQQINRSGANYIYAAFAEHPFGASNVFPTTAR